MPCNTFIKALYKTTRLYDKILLLSINKYSDSYKRHQQRQSQLTIIEINMRRNTFLSILEHYLPILESHDLVTEICSGYVCYDTISSC